MSNNFEKIAQVEQERILQAAFTEFADKGYRRASTNTIVKSAGIPKGTLFYYFGSKKNLFFYLVDEGINKYITFVDSEKRDPPSELFERLLFRQEGKLRFAVEYPLLFRFFSKVFLDIPEEIMDEMSSRFRKYSSASADDLSEGLDTSPFKENVNIEDAINIIHVLLEGIVTRYSPRLRDAEANEFDTLINEISDECRRYFALIKQGIYK